MWRCHENLFRNACLSKKWLFLLFFNHFTREQAIDVWCALHQFQRIQRWWEQRTFETCAEFRRKVTQIHKLKIIMVLREELYVTELKALAKVLRRNIPRTRAFKYELISTLAYRSFSIFVYLPHLYFLFRCCLYFSLSLSLSIALAISEFSKYYFLFAVVIFRNNIIRPIQAVHLTK